MKRIEKLETFVPEHRCSGWSIFMGLLVLVLAFSTGIRAQEQEIQSLGIEGALQHSVEASFRLPNGDLLMVGWVWRSRSGKDALLSRVTRDGIPVWEKVISTSQDDVLNDVATLPDGSFVAVGTTYAGGLGSSDILIVKFLEGGEIQWKKVIGGSLGEQGMAVTGTPDGRIAVVGLTESWGAGWQDILFVEMWLNGDVMITRTYGSTMPEEVYDIIPAIEGNGFVIAGAVMATRGGIDGLLLRVDMNGEVLWQRRWGGNGIDRFHRVIPVFDVEPGYVVTGYSVVFNQGYADFMLMRVTMDGQAIRWVRRIGSAYWDIAYDVKQTGNGFILVGYTRRYPGGDDALVVKTDWQGYPVSSMRFSSSFNDQFKTVENLPDGSFIALGKSPAGGPTDEIVMAHWRFEAPDPGSFCAFTINSEPLNVSIPQDNGYTWAYTTHDVWDIYTTDFSGTEVVTDFQVNISCTSDGGRPMPRPQPIDILPINHQNTFQTDSNQTSKKDR